MRRVFGNIVSTILITCCLCAVAFAQETTGSIEGTVKDPAGALVPNVTITVTDARNAGAGS